MPSFAPPWDAVPSAAIPGSLPIEPTFLQWLLMGWSVPSEVVDEVEALASEAAERAHEQGHGLVVMSVSFEDRRLRVAVVGEPAALESQTRHESPTLVVAREGEAGSARRGGVCWFELTAQPALSTTACYGSPDSPSTSDAVVDEQVAAR